MANELMKKLIWSVVTLSVGVLSSMVIPVKSFSEYLKMDHSCLQYSSAVRLSTQSPLLR